MEEKKRSSFSGTLGFIMAAAGSAVGLGNIWRFPYLAAKNGGGLFLVIYLVLGVTFGFALLVSEVAIGRKTKCSPISAYGALRPRWKWLGSLTVFVPFLVMPYYSVVGGWVLKYALMYLTGQGNTVADPEYFTAYVSTLAQPVAFMAVYVLLTAIVIYLGVSNGIEKMSKILLPVLVMIVIGISIFVLTISYTAEDGTTTTGIDGLLAYIIPDVSGLTFTGFVDVLVDAMGQIFFSIGVASGVMIAFGSYAGDRDNMIKSVGVIEIFDLLVAFLAGIMVIVPVYVFVGREGMNASGPSLLFVSMPAVFASMGTAGLVLGAVFFVMVFFAALTSSVSMMEAVVSSWMEKYNISRKKAVVIETVAAYLIGVVVCLGYNVFYFELTLPDGTTGQLLELMDYVSNNLLEPVVAIGTCILVGWILKPRMVVDEVTKNGEKFKRRSLYTVMVRFVAPVLLCILLMKSFGVFH